MTTQELVEAFRKAGLETDARVLEWLLSDNSQVISGYDGEITALAIAEDRIRGMWCAYGYDYWQHDVRPHSHGIAVGKQQDWEISWDGDLAGCLNYTLQAVLEHS